MMIFLYGIHFFIMDILSIINHLQNTLYRRKKGLIFKLTGFIVSNDTPAHKISFFALKYLRRAITPVETLKKYDIYSAN